MDHFWIAFGLTMVAGLSTGLGGLLAMFTRRTETRFLSIMLGFSAGVMIYISMMEIMVSARRELGEHLGVKTGDWVATAGFFGGILFISLIDRFVPDSVNPHEVHKVEAFDEHALKCHKLMRVGLFTSIAVTVHNFPEGIATFLSAMKDPATGFVVAIAVAMHNVPEGIAVSAPIFCATADRMKTFKYSLLSGMAEPVGALVGYFLLYPWLNPVTLGVTFAAVAGIMVFISLDELLPTACEYGEKHLSIYGLLGGMGTMALTLLLLG